MQIAPAVTFTPGRDWEKSCRFCFTRVLWALACTYTKWLFYFLLKTYFIDLFITPSFYLGWTETPCLDSLLYRNSATAGELRFPVLILWEHKDSITEFTLCPRQTRDASPNINFNAINSASGRWKPTCTICFVHLISTYPYCQPSTPFSPHLYKLLLSPPFLGRPFCLPFLLAKFKLQDEFIRRKYWEENTSWSQDRFDSKQGTSSPWARHMLLLIWRERCCW